MSTYQQISKIRKVKETANCQISLLQKIHVQRE